MVRVRLIQSTTALARKIPGPPSRAARRQAARTILPADGAFVTSKGDAPASARTESIDSPSARSPRHPLSSTSESGLFKYKTGIEEFSQPLRRFNGGKFIWKIYTAQPVLHDYRPALVAAIQEDDLPNGPATLLSTLRAAYLSALRAFGAFSSTRDVHLQYLSNYTGRALVIPGLARPVGTEDRVWNMRMMLHKPSTDAALSLPLVIISIPHVALSKHCTILINTADGRRHTIWALNIRVSGSLKASVFDPQTMNPTTSSSEQTVTKTDPIQSVVNRVLRETGTRVQARIFHSTHDLLAELEQIITQSLRTSGVATVLDLHGILLELVSDRRIRISHNRLLNPDGTPVKPLEFTITPHARSTASRPEPAVTLSAPLRAETTIGLNTTDSQDLRTSVSPNEHGPKASESSLATTSYKATNLSVAASKRLGITTLRAVLLHAATEDKTDLHAHSSSMVSEVERFCESSAESGLQCWLATVQYLSNYFPNTTATSLFSDHITIPSSWSNTTKRSTKVEISIAFPIATLVARPPLRLDITGFPEMRFKMLNVSSPCAVHVTRLHVGFDLATGEEGAGGPNHSLNQDLRQLAETSHRVIERLSKAMTFAEEASIPARLSEALLRVLRANTDAGEVVRVAVFLRPVTDNVLLPEVEDSPKNTQLVTGSPPTVVETTPAKPDWWTEHGLPTSSRLAFTEALEAVAPTTSKRRILQGAGSGGVHLLISGSIMLFDITTLKSASLTRMTGMQHYRYRVIWSNQKTFDAIGTTTSSVENSLEKSFSMTPAGGIECLRIATTQLATILPGQPLVVLEVYGSLPLMDPSYGPAYKLTNVLLVTTSAGKDANDDADTPSTNVKMNLPIIRGFACSDGTIENLVHIKVQHTLKSRCEQVSAKDIIGLAKNTIASVIRVVEPLFTTTDPDALDDSFARRIAAALLQRRTLCLDDKEPDQIVVKVGRSQACRDEIKFSGSASIRSTNESVEEVAGELTSLPVLEAADTDEAQMDAAFTESPPEKHFDSHALVLPKDSTKDSISVPEVSSPQFKPFGAGLKYLLEPHVVSENALERTGLANCGLEIVWPTIPEQGTSSIVASNNVDLLRRELDVGSGHGLQYLHDVASAICEALPGQPALQLRCRSGRGHWAPMDRSSYWNRFEVSAVINPISGSREPLEQCASIHSTLPHLLGELQSREGPPHRRWFSIRVAGSYAVTTNEHAKPETLIHIVPAARDVLHTTLAKVDSSDDPAAVAARIAKAVGTATSIFPEELTVQYVAVHTTSDGLVIGKQTALGSATWSAAEDVVSMPKMPGGVFVALGSNVGDRMNMIEKACAAINEDPKMHVIRTSPLYETEPMYVESQERFLNGVCELNTSLAPMELLERLQAVEQRLGRVKTVDKGPRNIDLDILMHRDRRVTSERLTVPHALMMEREFVIRPLTSMDIGVIDDPLRTSVAKSAKRFEDNPSNMFTHTPLGPETAIIQSTNPSRKTGVMAILNVTPDSFSDGGENQPADLENLKATIASYIAAGASIIDIGGQSSRPNAPDVTAEVEIARILPAIKVIQSLPSASHIAISIDTYRAAVAKAAVEAGAHIINDISAGTLDPDMLRTVAKLGCTYIMMHMRGTPATMQDPDNLSYPKGLIPTVADELRVRLNAAQDAGIRRWRIILDPGIGFAKTQEQNLEILRKLPELAKSRGLTDMPWLVGSSRKGFIGKITGVEAANERTWGTAATVTQAVQGGADIVRVHDVAEMAQVVKMADAMYRV
ncbi:trifunctional dihydropteroate synthetase [Elasticomyces elasticus]|nr:trifunctional dihydropteroate synthetase [Elasticomyces elasticus]